MNKWQKIVIMHDLRYEHEVMKKLEQYYRDALEDINTSIRIMQADELTQSKVYQLQYQQALKKQINGILERLHTKKFTTIMEYLLDSYTNGFVGTMYSVAGQGIPIIASIDQAAAVKAVITDSQISKGLYDHLGIGVDKMKKAIRAELTRGIASNMRYDDIARNIAATTNVPLNNAKNIVSTEGHRIQQAAANDARITAKAKGADMLKQWDATMDGDTRPAHRQLDGQIKEVNEYFVVGTKKARYPGDFGDPALDCRCRCVCLDRPRWALGEEELETMKDRAAFFGLDKTEDFEDYKKKYLDASKAVDTYEKSGIILEGEYYVSKKGFVIHQDKIQKYLLKPGAPHFQEFYSVGYRSAPGHLFSESRLLASDIEDRYDEANAFDLRKNADGSECFSMYMTLGFGGGKRFRTVWMRDNKNAKPRLITAHRE